MGCLRKRINCHIICAPFAFQDPNFVLKTEFKDNYLLTRFTYTGSDWQTQKLATINVYGYHNDRLPNACFLYYYNCEIKQ